MQKLLIADPSEAYTDALKEVFSYEFELQICHDGETALELLQSFAPDAIVINLHLPYKDGITVLMQSAHKPKVILALTSVADPYVQQCACRAGVQYLMTMPTVESLRFRLMTMINDAQSDACDLQGQTVVHLHSMGFRTNLNGYHQLCVGIPIYAKDPRMSMSKELYPAVAAHFHYPDSRTVEHSIRNAIKDAWKRKNPTVWLKYFSPAILASARCPSNKHFFSAVAENLELQPCNLSTACYNDREGSIHLQTQKTEEEYETDPCSR